MEYKVKIKKLNKYGSDYENVKLNIVEQEQLSELISKFLSANFETRKFILNCSENSDLNNKLVNFAEKYLK
jgi:hypothetical protein